jgi:hypothetical protein
MGLLFTKCINKYTLCDFIHPTLDNSTIFSITYNTTPIQIHSLHKTLHHAKNKKQKKKTTPFFFTRYWKCYRVLHRRGTITYCSKNKHSSTRQKHSNIHQHELLTAGQLSYGRPRTALYLKSWFSPTPLANVHMCICMYVQAGRSATNWLGAR